MTGSSGADVLMAGVSLGSPGDICASVTDSVLTDVMWVHALPADKLEHVRARKNAGRVEIVFFLNASSQEGAESSAREICRRAAAAAGVLAGWNYVKRGEEWCT